MDDTRLYHNPRCSKSRGALELLRERGIEPRIVPYLETPPSVAELETLLALLGLSDPRELMRRNEPEYAELGLAALRCDADVRGTRAHAVDEDDGRRPAGALRGGGRRRGREDRGDRCTREGPLHEEWPRSIQRMVII